jgi:hypothetical protein
MQAESELRAAEIMAETKIISESEKIRVENDTYC